MDTLTKPVRIARTRLLIQSMLDWLSRVAMVAFSVTAIAILLAKFIEMPMPFDRWVQTWLIAAGGATLLIAPILAIWFRPKFESVATMVDIRLKLHERLSSAMQLTNDQKASPMGNALFEDATKKAESIDVRDSFPVTFKPHWAQLVIPAVVIGFSFLLADPTPSIIASDQPQALTVEQVKNSIEPLIQQIKKQREEAEKENLEEAELFKTLESKLDGMKDKPPTDPTKLMTELKKMEQQLEEKRRELGNGESLKKQLANIKKMDDGPAEELADAMKDGDLEAASEQVQSMMERFEKGEMTKEEEKKLEEQLATMQEALEEAVKAHEQEKQQIEEQIKKAEAAGDKQQAADLKEKLDTMKQADSDMKAAKDMAESMCEACNGMAKGDKGKASSAMKEMQQKLSKMSKSAKQAASLKELSKKMSTCKSECAGNCNGTGNKPSDKTSVKDFAKGGGTGAGKRAEEKNDTSNYDSQVRGNVGEGETAFGGRIGGDNKKTSSQFEVKEAILNAEIEDPDPIEHAKLPKRERDVSREYMDALRTGKP
jgi:hypothetical protein